MTPNQWQKWVEKTAHPTAEQCKSLEGYWKTTMGWIYAARVGGSDRKWKVGKTGRKNPFLRVHELQATVSATETFELVWAMPVVQRHVSEKRVHQWLSQRPNRHLEKEFFEASAEDVKLALEKASSAERDEWAGWQMKSTHGFDPESWLHNPEEGLEFEWSTWWEVFGASAESFP
jgi:Meiotically up-regulated gene 113